MQQKYNEIDSDSVAFVTTLKSDFYSTWEVRKPKLTKTANLDFLQFHDFHCWAVLQTARAILEQMLWNSLSLSHEMLFTLVARCRIQLNPIINLFSPFYCPALNYPLNYTHNPTPRPPSGVIHASVHFCTTYCSLSSLLTFQFEKQTRTQVQLCGISSGVMCQWNEYLLHIWLFLTHTHPESGVWIVTLIKPFDVSPSWAQIRRFANRGPGHKRRLLPILAFIEVTPVPGMPPIGGRVQAGHCNRFGQVALHCIM